jgi:hypothetical protein
MLYRVRQLAYRSQGMIRRYPLLKRNIAENSAPTPLVSTCLLDGGPLHRGVIRTDFNKFLELPCLIVILSSNFRSRELVTLGVSDGISQIEGGSRADGRTNTPQRVISGPRTGAMNCECTGPLAKEDSAIWWLKYRASCNDLQRN